MRERVNFSEKPTNQFLKKLFFVTAGLFAAGVIAIELLPKMLHIFSHEIGKMQISGGGSHTLRRLVTSS